MQDGFGWKLGSGDNILISEHARFQLQLTIDYVITCKVMMCLLLHILLIKLAENGKREVIFNTFSARDAGRILQIPLEKERHDDLVVWQGESSGEFFVRSAYKLLQATLALILMHYRPLLKLSIRSCGTYSYQLK